MAHGIRLGPALAPVAAGIHQFVRALAGAVSARTLLPASDAGAGELALRLAPRGELAEGTILVGAKMGPLRTEDIPADAAAYLGAIVNGGVALLEHAVRGTDGTAPSLTS